MELEKIILQEIMAIMPKYISDKGNCSYIITLNGGSYEINKTMKTLLSQLCKYYLVDLKATKRYYGKLLNIKNLSPIPLNKENIFIPLKIRKPLFKNDGSIGYVNIKHIEKVSVDNDKSIIELINNKKIECLNSIDTVKKHINNGNIVKKLYEGKEKSLYINENYITTEYDQLASKGKVIIIIRN